ncbi:hypothetical protein SELMODRAFT_413339 [Selaginella moellendorffii]|uniref:V-SNARE coiled-coil homology domain-containing protein n=1 Tax=Selaginella moellendorffii TaxID=88036 RepID=D8RP52_SELML|nr:uncharacterized protein LOC9636557 [Selaginella moellendorffii]EFJ25975.1 hypothetical protein SELMODRAFT_413339 [Selaginella moellendorffii]|eukprot:XP_002972754.1 uncharacterized protein LOC9636557 [Selaginella moellendorffii]
MEVCPLLALRIRLVIQKLKRAALRLKGKKKRKSSTEQRIQPARRPPEEIKRDYGFQDSPAAKARAALAERHEKLERVEDKAQTLQSSAENFAGLAREVVREAEKTKWWQVWRY